MIYKHIRTGVYYRMLMDAFDVSRQCKMIVYVSLKTGEVFTREAHKFEENFKFILDAQSDIKPKEPHS